MVDIDLAKEMDIPEEPTQTLEEYLAEQDIRVVPHDALVLCNMGEAGFKLFFIGTENYKVLEIDDVIVYGGVIKKCATREIKSEELPTNADIHYDPMTLWIGTKANLATGATTVRGIGCFAEYLPANGFNYNKNACQNLQSALIQTTTIAFNVFQPVRNIWPIFKVGINCGHLLGWESDNPYFKKMGFPQKLYFKTGEKLDLPFAYNIGAHYVHQLKYLLSELANNPNEKTLFFLQMHIELHGLNFLTEKAITLAMALLTHTKDLLFNFSRKEQQKLIQYKEIFHLVLKQLPLLEQLSKMYLQQNLDKKELFAFMNGPNNALRHLVNEFKVVEKTFNFADWYIPIVRIHFNTTLSERMPNYKLPSASEAQLLFEQGVSLYKEALTIENDMLSQKEKLADAVSLLQEALEIFRICEERLNFNFVPFEDTELAATSEIAHCYWFLFKAYEKLELIPEAWYFIERCCFLLRTNKEIILDESIEVIKEAYRRTNHKLIDDYFYDSIKRKNNLDETIEVISEAQEKEKPASDNSMSVAPETESIMTFTTPKDLSSFTHSTNLEKEEKEKYELEPLMAEHTHYEKEEEQEENNKLVPLAGKVDNSSQPQITAAIARLGICPTPSQKKSEVLSPQPKMQFRCLIQ
jgi:hypothetical protein